MLDSNSDELNAKGNDTVFFISYDIMLGDIPGLRLYVDNSSGTSYLVRNNPVIGLVDENGNSFSKDVITVLINRGPDDYETIKIPFKRVVISNF